MGVSRAVGWAQCLSASDEVGAVTPPVLAATAVANAHPQLCLSASKQRCEGVAHL